MKKINIIKGLVAMLLMALAFTSCEDVPPLLKDVGAERVFTPIGFKATVSKQTLVTLTWSPRANVDHYVVDFSADDPNFTTIYKTINVTDADLPIAVQLEGLTTYSIRMKAVSSIGLADSKYDVITAKTLSEQLFIAGVNGDIKANSATLRWVPNSNVTNISLSPGDINHVITAEEKENGVATVEGLVGEVTYTANLMNNSKLRGVLNFKTEVDPTNGISVAATDNLSTVIANAPIGAKLYLAPGDYTAFKGVITLTKPISIYGLYSYNKPKLHVNFALFNGASDLKLQDLEMVGDGTTAASDAINLTGTVGNFGDVLITGCNIHNYNRLIYGSVSNKLRSFKVDNSIITDFSTNTADFVDFRATYVANIILTNSTFNNCVTGRDFVRVDNAGLTGTGLNTDVLIDACTIYNTKMLATNRIIYLRFATNSSKISNTLFGETPAIYTNQLGSSTPTAPPTYLNNNYYNSVNLFTPANPVNLKVGVDDSGTFGTLNPKFADAAKGNFKVGEQVIIDKKVGDPRWFL